MASQSESKIPGPGGGGKAGRDKRRSFLPAPKRSTIPSPTASDPALPAEPTAPPVKPQNESAPEEIVQEVIPGAENLTVGRRILISGVKPGILRFVGKTGLAPGNWCGIELFDASGLHDGEVDGTRYFTCKPFRGIFAPLDKVVLDESFKSPVREEKPLQASEDVQGEAKPLDEPELETVDKQAAADREVSKVLAPKSQIAHLSETEDKSATVDSEVSKIPAPKSQIARLSETVEKPAIADSEVSKIPTPKSQIARLSAIPRIGLSSSEKGFTKSKSTDGIKESSSKIAVFCRRSLSGQDASKVDLNSTFVRDDKQATRHRRRSEDADGDFSLNQTYSRDLEKHLQSDSRHYFNITFNRETPPQSNPASNLPDVVSSASPSPPRETSSRLIPEALNQTQSAQDIASSIATDMSLGLVDPDIIADETNLLEGVLTDRIAAATSESDVSLSGNSSSATLEDNSVATVNEAVAGLNSTPSHGVDFKKYLKDNGEDFSDNFSDADGVETSSANSVKQNLMQTFTAVSRKEELKDDVRQRKDSSSSISGISAVRADLLQEEGSNGVSPEVSQVLEWDYDHDAFDGKLLLEKCQDGMSTSTSDSCSEASADQGAGALAEKNAHDVDAPPPDGEEAHLFDESEDGFENIDNIEDFPLGMSKETQHMMTDSGISEKGFLDPAAEAASKRKSAEFDCKLNVVDLPSQDVDKKASAVDLPDEGPVDKAGVADLPGEKGAEGGMLVDANLQKDLMDGHAKQERPLSLVSVTSADTGYVPDTDSETGTLTTNSPTDWTEKQQLNASLATSGADPRPRASHVLGKPKQSLMVKGVLEETVKETEADSDIGCSDGDSAVVETAVPEKALDTTFVQEKEPPHDDTEDSEAEESGGEEEEDSSEEDTASEEEEEEEVTIDDRPEDDRIEADRVGLSGNPPPPAQPSAPPVGELVSDAVRVSTSEACDMTESSNLTGTEVVGTAPGVAASAGTSELTAPNPVSTREERPSDLKCDVSEEPDDSRSVTSTTADGGDREAGGSRSAPKKKLSLSPSPADKKRLAEHKKVVKSAQSRLTDYIKSPPPPPKPKETKVESKKGIVSDPKKNKPTSKKQDNGPSSVVDKTKGIASQEKTEKKPAPVTKGKPKVKHTAPKSKWGNIMTQIEASKDTAKPKTEVKSSVAVYRSTPVNTSPTKETEKDDKAKPKEDNQKPKSKLKPVKHSKPDFSNVRSKLNLSSPPKQAITPCETPISSRCSTPRDSGSPGNPGHPKENTKDLGNTKNSANPKGSGHAKDNPKSPGNPKDNLKGPGNPKDNPKGPGNPQRFGNPKGSGNVKDQKGQGVAVRKTSIAKVKTEKLVVDHVDTLDNWSTMSQASSTSRTDLQGLEEGGKATPTPTPGRSLLEKKRNALSCAGTRQKERSSSVASTKSDASSAQNPAKSKSLRSGQKHDTVAPSNVTASRRTTLKSSIPPPTPRTASNLTKAAAAEERGSTSSLRSKSLPLKQTPPAKPKRAAAPSSANTALSRANRTSATGSNQSLSRTKGAVSGLKSGHPPDVVSTSARGSRAQEVARLESLCEVRTKELNFTRMQLKAGLQAFDAMACLLNYCTEELNAFSCPATTVKLKTAEGKLTDQQQMIERLDQQKAELEQRVEEVTGARDSAVQHVARLRQEMTEAEQSHTALQQTLREEQAQALRTLEADLTDKHHNTLQQIQTCQEKQAEYTKQAQKRQMTELSAEHQMFTNQVKLAHLEEIQELRNKHDLQMEELHTQHRNKLEDITRRFESIKLSLSEKVQTLCVECDELRIRAKTSEEALQRDADVKVQLALSPYLHLPKEIESLRMVIDMRTEEIQKLRRHNMDLEKQLEELPIAQEKVASLQQKVENLQAIINIKTDHEKQLHEKCQVLMRKYDRESRANKRLSMDYEQVVWRMSQSADLTGSMDSLGRQLSTSPGRGGGGEDHHCHTSPSPVRRTLSNMSQGEGGHHSPAAVVRRQRRISGGDREEDVDRKIRCRSATFSLDKSKSPRSKANSASGANGSSSSPGSPSKQPASSSASSSADYADLIVAAMNDQQSQSLSSEQGAPDVSEVTAGMKSSVILENSRGVSYNIDVVENGRREAEDRAADEVFMENPSQQTDANIPHDLHLPSTAEPKPEVTVIVNSPTSD